MAAPQVVHPARDPVEEDHGHAGLDQALEGRSRPLLPGQDHDEAVGPRLAQEAVDRLDLGPRRALCALRLEEVDPAPRGRGTRPSRSTRSCWYRFSGSSSSSATLLVTVAQSLKAPPGSVRWRAESSAHNIERAPSAERRGATDRRTGERARDRCAMTRVPLAPPLVRPLWRPRAAETPRASDDPPRSQARRGASRRQSRRGRREAAPVFYETTTVTARPVSSASGAVTVVVHRRAGRGRGPQRRRRPARGARPQPPRERGPGRRDERLGAGRRPELHARPPRRDPPQRLDRAPGGRREPRGAARRPRGPRRDRPRPAHLLLRPEQPLRRRAALHAAGRAGAAPRSPLGRRGGKRRPAARRSARASRGGRARGAGPPARPTTRRSAASPTTASASSTPSPTLDLALGPRAALALTGRARRPASRTTTPTARAARSTGPARPGTRSTTTSPSGRA